MEKEIKITPPEGYEIDKENSTFDCIKFKPIAKRWADDENKPMHGYYITSFSDILKLVVLNRPSNYKVFATEKQAKSALAMARISQIMANDPRFGGPITDEEWKTNSKLKFSFIRMRNQLETSVTSFEYNFLAFHKPEQRNLFLEENEQLVRDYLMIE